MFFYYWFMYYVVNMSRRGELDKFDYADLRFVAECPQ